MNQQAFQEALDQKGVHLSATQMAQFEQYYHLLVDWNERINLTAITDQQEVYLKHFYDSLMPLWLTPYSFEDQKLIDIGAGAGFPSIPMAIAVPTLQVTIVDSLNKRIQFLNTLCQELGLSDRIQAIHARAEDVGQDPKYRGQFDLVTARAVAALPVLSELCLPLAKKGGHFLALKGARADEEVQEATKAIQVLGAKYETTVTEALPNEEGERAIVLIRKTLDTPKKYPRKAGKPNKQPIR